MVQTVSSVLPLMRKSVEENFLMGTSEFHQYFPLTIQMHVLTVVGIKKILAMHTTIYQILKVLMKVIPNTNMRINFFNVALSRTMSKNVTCPL